MGSWTALSLHKLSLLWFPLQSVSNVEKVIMGYSYKLSFWFSINAKAIGIWFVNPIKQPELTNFLFTFWLKNTFHVPLSWLLMVPIVVNSDRKKKIENFLCPKVVLFSASLGVNR